MNPKDSNKPYSNKKTLFSGLSIQQRLPLLICILLLCTIIIFAATAYYGIKKASLETGKERLNTLINQLSSGYTQSSQTINSSTGSVARHEDIKRFVTSGDSQEKAKGILNHQVKDTTIVLAELLDKNGNTLLYSNRPGASITIPRDSVLAVSRGKPDSSRIGKLYAIRDSIYYPLIAPVTDDKRITGYFIKWKLMLATPEALESLSKVIGTNGKLYFGNSDGSLWTDMISRINNPPLDSNSFTGSSEYSTPRNENVIAAARPINNTEWLVLVEFPRQKVLELAGRTLQWLMIIGAVLLVAGITIARTMSRNITRPLNKLTLAASSISRGDYSAKVEINRRDELGKLGHAFNLMTDKIDEAHQNLEKKVQERTRQLETANRELEAFSYSVSHDLRAPLRAIGGYAKILKEDYGEKFDDEAERLTNTIITKSKMMGQLIDDLIMFSRTGRKELVNNPINMKELAETCTTELLQTEPGEKYSVKINPLPDCMGEETLMRQVWINLIGNAIKYSSQKNKSCIEIGCKEDHFTNTYFIKDNGVGFDMQYAHKLFGVFERLHDQQTFQGTGIGLAIVKRIIDKHKGKVWAEASPGEGATFYFSIPKNKES